MRAFADCGMIEAEHAVLSSRKQKNRLQETTKVIDRRTCGAHRRKEALTKSTDLIVSMVRRALALFIQAKYLLMDSWFSFPSVVRPVMGLIHAICMVKNTPKVLYEVAGQSITVAQIHRKLRKRKGKAKIKGTVEVGIGEGKSAKFVFLRRRHGGAKWLALLCTDLSLPDEEVVRTYGKQRDIAVLFKMAKHYLKLDSEIQLRDSDAIVAHSTIVMIRYVFFAVEQKMSSDERTIGGLFLATGEEIRDLSLAEALVRILSLAWDRVRDYYATSEQLLLEIIEYTMREALSLIRPRLSAKCES